MNIYIFKKYEKSVLGKTELPAWTKAFTNFEDLMYHLTKLPLASTFHSESEVVIETYYFNEKKEEE